MPPISTTVVDTNAVQLLTEWINTESAAFQSFSNWQAANFPDPQLPVAAPTADPDNDASSNYLEFLIGTDPNMSTPPWEISARTGGSGIEIHYPQIARRGFEVQWTANIFDPASWQPLDVPGNAPFFSATDFAAVVEDQAAGQGPKFYRVRVFER